MSWALQSFKVPNLNVAVLLLPLYDIKSNQSIAIIIANTSNFARDVLLYAINKQPF